MSKNSFPAASDAVTATSNDRIVGHTFVNSAGCFELAYINVLGMNLVCTYVNEPNKTITRIRNKGLRGLVWVNPELDQV